MKSAEKQMKRKAFYAGPSAHITYSGSRTQPGYEGLPAGSKLSLKATRNRLDSKVVGIVSKSYENIAKGKR